MENEAREIKLPSSGKPARELFPISPENVKSLLKDGGRMMFNPYLPMLNIKVAPNTLVVSIVNKNLAEQSEKILDCRERSLRFLSRPTSSQKVGDNET